jgi:hypothetical protein
MSDSQRVLRVCVMDRGECCVGRRKGSSVALYEAE